MKTLNINKLTILLGLFLVSAFFTTGANAACVVNAAGAIDMITSADNGKIHDTVTTYDDDGEVDYEAGGSSRKNDCTVTPDAYKLKFYKVGVCTADPDLNDLTSCQMFFESAAGIEVDVQKGVSNAFDIPEFTIDPGTYPWLYVQISAKLGMRWQAEFSSAVTGKSSSSGIHCWSEDALVPFTRSAENSDATVATAFGTSLAYNANSVNCGTQAEANAGMAFANEALTRFSEGFCDSALAANGDRTVMQDKEGAGGSRGLPTISLLTSADAFATTCLESFKIAWTTDLDTAYTVTEESDFDINIQATSANELVFSGLSDLLIKRIGSGAPKISLNVEG